MKKLMAMIGAVAMSFGLFATGTPTFSISFETAESEKGVSDGAFNPNADGVTGWTWAGDPLALSEYLTGEKFQYGSGNKARRDSKFDGETENNNYLPLETGTDELIRDVGGNAFLDQLVKFTGFEDPQTNLVSDTKIAIWMSEFENEDESTTTNLYVTVGKIDVAGNAEQIALPIAPITGSDGYELNTWYRLSVKSLGNITTDGNDRAGFLIYINGQKVASSDDEALTLIADDVLTSEAKSYMAQKQLFTAIDDTDATFASVGYQGIGAVDDIILDAEGPEFCKESVDVTIKPVEGAVIASVTDKNGDEVDPDETTGAYTLPIGDFTITWVNDEGYMTFEKEIAHTTDDDLPIDDSAELAEEIAEVIVNVIYDAQGAYDESEYASAAEALAAVEEYQSDDANLGKEIDVEFAKEASIANFYSFAEGTAIVITDDSEDAEAGDPLHSFWDISGGDVTLLTGLENNKIVTFDCGEEIEGVGYEYTLTFAGLMKDGAKITAASIAVPTEGKILLSKDATIETETVLTEGEDIDADDEDYEIDVGTGTTYTYLYSAAQSEPPVPTTDTVTFTVTYDTDEVENVTVKTNGADVVDALGVYTVKSNEVVTVAATAKTGYQNVTITGNNVTVDNGVFTASEAESIITIEAEEIPPAPGFMIRIAGIDAADVEEGTDSITIKTEAQPLVYINGAAATVAGEAGAWTVAKPAITADTAISIVKGANIPTTGHAWYENPTLMGKTKVLNTADNDGAGGYNGGLDLAGDYIAGAFGYTSQGLILTTVSDLFTDTGDGVDPILTVSAADSINKSVRGAAVSTALGVMVVGSAGSNPIAVYSLDGSRTNLVTTSNGVTPDSFAFSADGKYMWANAYKPSEDRNKVFLYEVKDNLIGDGEKLVLKETYVVGTRVRGIRVFGNHVYAKGDPDDEPGWLEEGWYHMDASADTPAFTKIGDLFWDKNADDISIVGDHLYAIATGSKLNVYNLDADGVWVDGDPIKVVDLASIGVLARDSGNSFFVSDDEETFIAFNRDWAAKKNTIAAYQWTLPTYDITFAAVENGTLETSVTNDISAGTTVTVTATPVTGYECTEITTNGSAITGTSFDMPADDVEIGATFALQQFTVAEISVENATAVATNKATDTGLDLPATVDYNTAIAVTVTPDTGYEYKTTPAGWNKNTNGSITTNATVTANLAITVEAPTKAGPVVPPEQGDIELDPSTGGYNVTPKADVTEIDVTGLGEGATYVAIPPQVNSIKGVPVAKVKVLVPTGAPGSSYDITAAFKMTGDATTGITLELDETASVKIDEETIKVKPTIGENVDAEDVKIADGEIAVQAIPGLTYELVRNTELGNSATEQTADIVKATTTKVELEDKISGDKPVAAFYQIKVEAK